MTFKITDPVTAKFSPKIIGPIDRPTIIVGEKPGKQRVHQQSKHSLHGNRTGDFVHTAIEGLTNIILTNVTNSLYKGDFRKDETLQEGVQELEKLFKEYLPSKVICLGAHAAKYAASISMRRHVLEKDCEVICLPHPSWVSRFHYKEKPEYIKKLTDSI